MKIVILSVVFVFLSVSTASASNKSSISLVGNPTFGNQVTFSINTSQSYPWVEADCSQNGQIVYQQYAGFFSSYSGSRMFTLGPTELWDGGSASCVARLQSFDSRGTAHTLTETTFQVSG